MWLRYIPLLLWMGLIFWGSATPNLRTVPLVQRLGLLPLGLDPETLNLLEWILRKGAHMAVFGILALLAHWALSGTLPDQSARRHALLAFGIAVVYAITDEWHQTFVPTRCGAFTDVLIDSMGAALALLAKSLPFR